MPAVLLTGHRRAESWATYSGLMAGFFYYLCLIGAGGPVYGTVPPGEIYLSMVCHGTLYVCGLVLIGTRCFPQTDGWKLLAGTALVGVHALLLRPLSGDAGTLFIYQLMDGALLRHLLPDALAAAALPAYYILLAALLCLSVRGFFRQNQIQHLCRAGAAQTG